MPRNLNRRVETLFPVEDAGLALRIRDEILTAYLLDNVKARRMMPDGTYKRAPRGEGQKVFHSQDHLMGQVVKNRKKNKLVW
jgi:polyphosphate kinase